MFAWPALRFGAWGGLTFWNPESRNSSRCSDSIRVWRCGATCAQHRQIPTLLSLAVLDARPYWAAALAHYCKP